MMDEHSIKIGVNWGWLNTRNKEWTEMVLTKLKSPPCICHQLLDSSPKLEQQFTFKPLTDLIRNNTFWLVS
jgi:hypothetical protein